MLGPESNYIISAITKWIHYDPQIFVKPCSQRLFK